MRRKRKQRELTQYQLEQREYSAYRQQARYRAFMSRIGVSVPWQDPTVPQDQSDDE